MPLIYITGISGSGKSTVLKILQDAGYEAHGVDEEGYGDWIHHETLLAEQFDGDDPNISIHEWYENHSWVLSRQRILGLKIKSDQENKLILLVGSANDEDNVSKLFDKIIYLAVDENNLKHRIQNRSGNDFGKVPKEMEAILKWMRENDQRYRDTSDLVIDANLPLNNVVEQVVEGLSSHE